MFTTAAVVLAAGVVTCPAAADTNSVWEIDEFALWEHINLSGNIYDYNGGHGSYHNVHFVNTNIQINDKASSTANGKSDRRCAYQHAGYAQPMITHLPYGQISGQLSYAYSSLGWANDQLSSDGSC